MIFKIWTSIAMLAICSAEIKNQSQEKQAVSTQMLKRDDIPMSYKFTTIHTKPVSKSNTETHEHHRPHAAVQYAPVHPVHPNIPERYTQVTVPKTHDFDNTRYGNDDESNDDSSNLEINKQHLEPKDTHTETNNLNDWKYKNFVPGHNVEVLQSVNSNPVHNTVYRSSADEEGKTPNKVNYLRQYIFHQDPTTEASTIAQFSNNFQGTTNIPNVNSALYTLLGRQYYRPNIYIQNENIPQENILVPHLKNHKLHLNVARNYGVAQTIPKANVNFMYPSHTQAFIQRIPMNDQLRNLNQKTHLFPILNLNQRYLVRTS